MSGVKKAAIIIFGVLLLDQILKIWVKSNMYLGQEYHILGNWFIIHFTENNGMAFGMEFAGDFGKISLSLFRIVAVIGISWYLYSLIKKGCPNGVIISLSLIIAGAMGNILDSAFYGLIFSESYFQLAQLFPEGGGYASFLHGRVVDMLYFPLIEGTFPTWFPFWGGENFIFFRPVFNIADSSITIGVLIILLFQRKYFSKPEKKAEV